MRVNGIEKNAIYKTIEPCEDGDIYAYVRGWSDTEIGFSVLDKAVENPDFSNCGMFWVKPKDFKKLFKIYKKGRKVYWRENYGKVAGNRNCLANSQAHMLRES